MSNRLPLLLALAVSSFASAPLAAMAGEIKPSRVSCYFFENDQLSLKDTRCINQGWSWAGGGGTTLKWSDGVTTKYQWGLQGRGTPVCPKGQEQIAIDGMCGKSYKRHLRTYKRLSEQEIQTFHSDDLVHCVQLEKKSVCWLFPTDPSQWGRR